MAVFQQNLVWPQCIQCEETLRVLFGKTLYCSNLYRHT